MHKAKVVKHKAEVVTRCSNTHLLLWAALEGSPCNHTHKPHTWVRTAACTHFWAI